MTVLAARGVAVRQLVPDHRRAPHILALGIAGVPASALRNVLASRGVYISTGSACADADTKKSHVLEAIGLSPDAGMVRLSFGLDTTADEVTRAATILADVVLGLAKR
jgi:cysteine desulfurase